MTIEIHLVRHARRRAKTTIVRDHLVTAVKRAIRRSPTTGEPNIVVARSETGFTATVRIPCRTANPGVQATITDLVVERVTTKFDPPWLRADAPDLTPSDPTEPQLLPAPDDSGSRAISPVNLDFPPDAFSRIYGREAQIRRLTDAVSLGRDTNWTKRKHTLFLGPPGCISGETLVRYATRTPAGERVNHKGGSLKSLFDKFTDRTKQRKPQPLNYFIQSVTATGDVFLNKINDVIYSGEKSTWTVTTETGKTFRATWDHRIRTPGGYRPLSKLAVGDHVITNPGKVEKQGGKKKTPYRPEVFVKYHPTAKEKIVNGCSYKRLRVYQAVYEAWANNLSYDGYVNLLNNYDGRSLWTIPQGVDVRHKDENYTNNSLANLELVPHETHPLQHKEQITTHITIRCRAEKIVSIEPFGTEPVYDLVMEDPHRNFEAGGVFVHNCGKTETMLTFARLLGEENKAWLWFDATGTTRAGAIEMLMKAETVPPVLFVEEIEKTQESSLRWLLGVMDERGEVRRTNYRVGNQVKAIKLCVVATCNNEKLLKEMDAGALYSRFANRVYCPEPTREVLRKILIREVSEMGGLDDQRYGWVEAALEFGYDRLNVRDPRELINMVLCGRDRLLDGSYQQDFEETLSPWDRQTKAAAT